MQNRENLYNLLSNAICKTCDIDMSSECLTSAFRLSKLQGVFGVAFQGLQKAVVANNIQLNGATENIYLQWMGVSAKLVQNSDRIRGLQKRLHTLFEVNNVSCLLLKGLSISEYYEESGLRVFGDLDIYSPIDYVKINDLIKSISKDYTDAYYRHSEFNVDGVMVENHRYLTDVRGQYCWHKLEKFLKDVASSNLASTEVCGLHYPDETFTFVFFVYHALSHFIYGKLTMKFLVDWCMLMKGRKSLPDKVIDERLKEFGLMRFAAYMSKLCVLRFGLPDECLTDGISKEMAAINEHSLHSFEEDMFKEDYIGFSSNSIKDRINRGLGFYRKRWKIEEFLNVSVTRFVWNKMIAILN